MGKAVTFSHADIDPASIQTPGSYGHEDIDPSSISYPGQPTYQQESLPKRLLRSTIDTAVPIATAVGAGALATPSTYGLGTIAAGGLGYAGGKQIAKAMDRYLLGDEEPGVGVQQATVNAAKDVGTGMAYEVGGKAISEVPVMVKGGYGSFKDYLRNKLGQGLEYTPIANKAQVEAAGQALGVPVPRGVLTDNETFQKLDSALSQNSSPLASKTRNQYNSFNKGLKDAGEKIADLAEGDNYSKGSQIKGDLTGQVELDRQATKDAYDKIAPDLQKIQVNKRVVNRTFGDLKRNPIFQTAQGRAYLEDAQNVALQQPELNSLKEWRTSVSDEIGPTSSPLDQKRSQAIRDAATKIRDESIHALKSEMPRELHPEIDNFLDHVALADATHKSTIDEINSIKDVVGSKDFKSPVSFLQKLDSMGEEELAKRAAQADVSTMQALKKYPTVFEKVKQAKINQMVQGSSGRNGFNSDTFLKQYGKLDQEMKDLIFDPKTQEHIENLRILKQAEAGRAQVGKSGTPEGLNYGQFLDPRQHASAFGVNAILNDAERASVPKLKPQSFNEPIVPKDFGDFADRSSKPAQVLEMLKGASQTPPTYFDKAAGADEKGKDKWAKDGLKKLEEHSGGSADFLKDKSSMLDDEKIKGLLIQASDLKPGSPAMEVVANRVRALSGLNDATKDVVKSGPGQIEELMNGSAFKDTGRKPRNPGEKIDSVLGVPARVAISEFQKGNLSLDGLKKVLNSIGADPEKQPTGFDISEKMTDNPYLGGALATLIDVGAQVPIGTLSKLAKVSPGFAAAIKGVKDEGNVANAAEAFAQRGKTPPSTDARIAQMYGQTGEVRDAMPDLTRRATDDLGFLDKYIKRPIEDMVGPEKTALDRVLERDPKAKYREVKSAYDNPRNQPAKTAVDFSEGDRLREAAKDPFSSDKIYKVNSDNHQDVYMTGDAYRSARNEMSSGDFGSHKAELVKSAPKDADVLTLDDVSGDAPASKAAEPYQSKKNGDQAPTPKSNVIKLQAGMREEKNVTGGPEPSMLDRLRSRFGNDTKMQKKIDAAQKGPDHLPYVGTGGPHPFPNFEVKPIGVIGEPRIQGYSKDAADPFSWTDDKWNVSKNLLAKHKDAGMPAEINTSSDLIAKDDYIKEIPKDSVVNFYVTSPNEQINRILFPGNASRGRMDLAIQKLKDAGIKVNVIEPTVESLIAQSKQAYPNSGGLKFGPEWTKKELIDQLKKSGVLTDAEKAAGVTPLIKKEKD
jgi:hypothetical protein